DEKAGVLRAAAACGGEIAGAGPLLGEVEIEELAAAGSAPIEVNQQNPGCHQQQVEHAERQNEIGGLTHVVRAAMILLWTVLPAVLLSAIPPIARIGNSCCFRAPRYHAPHRNVR